MWIATYCAGAGDRRVHSSAAAVRGAGGARAQDARGPLPPATVTARAVGPTATYSAMPAVPGWLVLAKNV